MNKRARLTRRILREHRRFTVLHFQRSAYPGGDPEAWRCTHCHPLRGRVRLGRAYR